MGIYDAAPLAGVLSGVSYPGRGIIAGRSQCGRYAAAAYFIMGRSTNSRNRVFRLRPNGDVYTAAFDESLVADPSLIIYNAVRSWENRLIVTNGDQTDTVYDALAACGSFESALRLREFEPDRPNFTPRISALFTFDGGDFTVSESILKSCDAEGSGCSRYFFEFGPMAPGTGRYIHTYNGDGEPLPTFTGEPELVTVRGGIDEFTREIWDSLDGDNKISLYVRFTDLAGGGYDYRLVNKNK